MNKWFVVSPLALLSFCLLPFTAVQAANIVSLTPSTTTVGQGGIFTVDIAGFFDTPGNLVGVDGGGLVLDFNAAVLQVNSIVIADPPWDFIPPNFPDIDNTLGSIEFLFNDTTIPGSVGALDIATITFSAFGEGTSNLTLTESALNPFAGTTSDDQIVALMPAMPGVTQISVTAVPLPGAVWLLLSGLGLLGALRRQKDTGQV